MAFAQRPVKPVVPVARQPKRVLQLVNPDTNESVDLASVAKEATKLQVRFFARNAKACTPEHQFYSSATCCGPCGGFLPDFPQGKLCR